IGQIAKQLLVAANRLELMMNIKPFAVWLIVLASATNASAETCDLNRITLSESAYRINYSNLADTPIAEILSQGELEYIKSDILVASGTIPANQKRRLWRKHVRALSKRKLPEYRENFVEPSIYFFRIGTPKMFQALRSCVSADDPVLGYISALSKFPTTVLLNN
ncbi:hypothetical protein, partial [Marinobacter alexandrii]|uniref:hypothetical protein n=1 Tax=Marinobacter alexandrii TaxID=2570351 RepID=UPI0032983760